MAVQISKTAAGGYQAILYSLDQGGGPIRADTTTFADGTVKITISDIGATYEGKLSADGQTFQGIFTQGQANPLELARATPATAWAIDPTPHKVSYVTMSDGVKLEVLDYGGQGRPLVFIPGLGADGHTFDKFAPRFTANHHVYAVGRRGYGFSDRPDPATGADYTADRLGDDVLTVLDQLKLDRPVLAGWSLGGEEMSSIASRHPDRVAGLVYLDAGYAYSFYAPGNLVPTGSNLIIDLNSIHARLDRAQAASGPSPAEAAAILDRLTAEDLPALQADLAAAHTALLAAATALPHPAAGVAPAPPPPSPKPKTLANRIADAIMAGEQKYTALNVPILAVFAFPHAMPSGLPEAARAQFAAQDAATAAQIDRFQTGNPKAKVIRLAHAEHDVFNSNPDEVAREMDGFMAGLR